MPSITKSTSLLALTFFANGVLGDRFAQFCNEYAIPHTESSQLATRPGGTTSFLPHHVGALADLPTHASDNCSEGCGISVNVNDPGCLTEFGRGSILFHGDNVADVSLIASPGSTCDCQNYCEDDIVQSVIHFNNYNPTCFTLRDEEVCFVCFPRSSPVFVC